MFRYTYLNDQRIKVFTRPSLTPRSIPSSVFQMQSNFEILISSSNGVTKLQADSETGPEVSVYELHDVNGGQDVLIMLLTEIDTLKMVLAFGHAQAFYQVCKRQAVRGVVYNY
ncbi:hypothetical protein HanIR_Chr02g0091391 [Helianthus annuus]|nr:hypothetical protein HanIR_Chr02g0091391 [Helianthus annuus]